MFKGLSIVCLVLVSHFLRAGEFVVIPNSPIMAERGCKNGNMETNGEKLVLKHFLKAKSIVFDVGANKGEWSQAVTDIEPNVALHAFEPIPQVFAQLSKRFDSSDITLNDIALSNESGSCTFQVYDKGTMMSGFYERPLVNDILSTKPRAISVRTERLDSYCKRKNIDHIDFLKIDTEGAELLVLTGCKGLLENKKIKVIQFEYGGCYQDAGTTLKEAYELLGANGYTLYRIFEDGLIKIVEWEKSLENFHYANYLALPTTVETDYAPFSIHTW